MADPDTVSVRPGAHRLFLEKAHEFQRAMDGALEAGDPNACASAAAHCVISAADALLAAKTGRRSRARDHAAVLRLIEAVGVPGARERADQIEFVLRLKPVAEYDDRDVTAADVGKAAKMARRFLTWVEAQLKG